MRSWLCLTALVWSVVASSALAGKYNEVLSIGDAAPAWKDLPGIDGENHSLSEIKAPIVIVAFTCNSCPYAKDYEKRLIAITTKYADDNQVAVVAINVNTHEEDRLPAMQEHAVEKGFNFAYLYDESQQIAKNYGAVWTPEFFVLNADRKIVYMGAFDDHTDPDQVNRKYVDEAVIATQDGGSPEVAETAPRGCAIKFNPVKRERKKPAE